MTEEGLALIGASTLLLLMIAWLVLLIIARWRVFTKAGEKGWKSLIPIYSDYVEWRIAWKKIGLFWLALGLVVLGSILMGVSGAYVVDAAGQVVVSGGGNTALAGLGSMIIFAALIIDLIATYKLMCAFGHGIGWTILYIIFSNIMLLVLGFGASRYIGPQN